MAAAPNGAGEAATGPLSPSATTTSLACWSTRYPMLAFRRADRQRVQAVPAVLVRPGPGVLGGGEPRRAGPGPGLARRHAAATWRCGSGEPAANPYLYLASNIAAGLGWHHRRAARRQPRWRPTRTRRTRTPLPASLADAIEALDADSFYRGAFGDTLVDYLVQMKRAEVKRYHAYLAEQASSGAPVADPDGTVTDWETREYFEFF